MKISRGNCLALTVLFGLLFAAHVCESKHFTVRVADPSRLEQVADVIRQRGYYVKHIDTRFKFVSFSTTPLPTVGEVVTAGLNTADEQPAAAAAPCALTGDTSANTPLYASSSDAARCAAGIQPTFPGPRAAQQAVVAAAADPAELTIQSLTMAIPGAIVEEDVPVYLLNRKMQQAGAAAAAEPAQSSSCSPGPDGAIGKTVEEVPYGIKMVQAIEPAMIEVSKAFKSKVLYCVIDTGLDITNPEFSENTFGCVPKSLRVDGSNTSCKFPWSKDWSSHGTHTSGTIAAARNSRGIVGVSAEGAQLFHYNAFGPMGTFSMSDVIVAITECVHALDGHRITKSEPDMKLVVSMSFGAEGDTPLVREAVKTLARERFNDMLLIAAAGNGAMEGAVYSYPAAWPEVVSVAAVDWSGKRASFSQINDRNDWAAPGVQTLSTVPVSSAASSSYNAMPSVSLVNAPSTMDAELLKTPAPRLLGQSKTARITAQLVDCGLGKATCEGATGKICLIQRGENTFCSKVSSCVAGGGIGAIIYGRDDMDDCETFDGSMDGGCTKPAAGWPVGLTITKAQGQALKTKIAEVPNLALTIDARKSTSPLPYDFMSGTSMATPTAAGVAGLVWSAHTECSGPELRAAISWSAADLGTPGYDNEFGHGLVQAAAAHKYLQENRCTGTRSPTEPSKTPAGEPAPAPVRTLTIASNATGRVRVGSVVRFTAKVTSSETARAEVHNVNVRLRPSPPYSMACGTSNVVKTNAAGVAVVHCSIVSPGTVALEARIGSGDNLVVVNSTVVAYGRVRAPPTSSP